MLGSIVLFFVGLALLYYGADYLVEGSSRLALSYGVRRLVVGMTIVSFATSMPELLVSLLALIRGSSDIAVGNIVGSNIANIGLILGASAMVAPLLVPRGLIKRELPFMIATTGLLFLFCFDGELGRAESLIFLSLLAGFIFYCIRTARTSGLDVDSNGDGKGTPSCSRGRDLLFIAGGIVGLGIGAQLMVDSAVLIARSIGLSELVIGMTIVALGTSLPELAASMVSASKGEMEISIGNVIGSNIFNILFVLGFCGLFRPIEVAPSLLRFELPVVLGFSLILIPLCRHGYQIDRVKGSLLLVAYLLFVSVLYLV
ncbi:MAG: calcium/sodium antiporter [Desulfuromonadaceae bacterium]|nr:calcium/sodium antiporter [Desulfuromonadaceae bacterium]